MTMPTTRSRVPEHTTDHVNARIERELEENVRRYAFNPEDLEQRLRELDAEWDIERAIEMNASALAFTGTLLGFFLHPYWLVLPAAVTAFLFQHAVQGWCPPVPVLRRMGFRTAYEIDREKYALKTIRGDFDTVAQASDKAAAALHAAKR